jgi:hypothetical protein
MNFTTPSWQPELGILAFGITLKDNLNKRDARRYLENGNTARHVHLDQLVVTLRSLVASSLSFDSSSATPGDSCAISAAFKFVDKDGKHWSTNGAFEAEFLRMLKDRYAMHGLDY